MGEIPHIRTSERRSFKRCQQQWAWAWRDGLISKSHKADALWFGTGIHLALEERYKYPGKRRGKNVLKVWRDYVGDEVAAVRVAQNIDSDGGYSPEEDWVDAGELGEAMLGAYLDEYGLDERWHVISAEQTFEIPIPHPKHKLITPAMETEGVWTPNKRSPLAYYNGTFDLVALDEASENGRSLMLWDHKTAKAIQTHHLSLDDQAGSYWAFASSVLAKQGLIEPGMKLDGILYNFLRKAKPDTRPKDAEGYACNKPFVDHYRKQILANTDCDASVIHRLKKHELEELAARYGITVLGERSANQPTPNFLRTNVLRTSKERRTQVRRIQAEALQMDAVRSKMLPIVKNPTKDCAYDCSFFALCEMQEAGDDWREFRDMMYNRRDPYADHRKAATDS